MKTTRAKDDRTVFRLDFALRGHGAYVEPKDLERLVELVEAASLELGAPLLRYLEHTQADKVA
jgi:hypothetical protein